MATSNHLQTSAEDKKKPFIIQLSDYGLSKVFKYYLNILKSSTLELIDEICMATFTRVLGENKRLLALELTNNGTIWG